MAKDTTAEEVKNLHSARKADMDGIFSTTWQTLANYFLPQLSNINTDKTEGVVGWTDEIFDTTAIDANQICAAGQRNWLTPSNEKWAAFTASDLLPDKDEAEKWYAECTDIALQMLANSNFYTNIHEFYLSRGGFGTAIFYVEPGRRNVLNFAQWQISTYCIQEDDEGFVDTMSRQFELTARQAVMKFGLANVGENIAKAYNAESQKAKDKKFTFIHEIRPRLEEERDRRKKGPEDMPYSSVYIETDPCRVARKSGYEEQPFMVSRFLKWGKTPYGYAPSFLCLPNVRELNYIVRFIDALAELRANPRVLVPSSLKGDVDMRSGGVTTVDDQLMQANVLPREWMTQGDYPLAKDMIAMKQDSVKRAYFVDLFNMMNEAATQSRERMTAEEVRARMSEKLEQFSPTFDRMTTEVLNPLLKRVFGILYRGGHFPEPPASVMVPVGSKTHAPAMPEIQYTSRIALQLRSLRNRAFTETVQVVGQMAAQKPDIMDNFDVDTGVREFALDQGLNPKLLRPMKKVTEIRAERLKQQQAQQQLALAEQAASAAGKLGKAPPQLQERMLNGNGLS
jgi:hypothetical protein